VDILTQGGKADLNCDSGMTNEIMNRFGRDIAMSAYQPNEKLRWALLEFYEVTARQGILPPNTFHEPLVLLSGEPELRRRAVSLLSKVLALQATPEFSRLILSASGFRPLKPASQISAHLEPLFTLLHDKKFDKKLRLPFLRAMVQQFDLAKDLSTSKQPKVPLP